VPLRDLRICGVLQTRLEFWDHGCPVPGIMVAQCRGYGWLSRGDGQRPPTVANRVIARVG